MPKKALAHIQKTAPGPPVEMAVAAPARLPAPIWAETAADSAWKEETPPFPLPDRPNTCRQAAPKRRTWTKRNRKVKYTPVPHKRTSRNGSHKRLLHCASKKTPPYLRLVVVIGMPDRELYAHRKEK